MRLVHLPIALFVTVSACGGDELVHGLDEPQAIQVLVALDEGGVSGRKRRDEGNENSWLVEVRASEGSRARRILAEHQLPRTRPPGFGEVFGKGSVVPTPAEERALYLHALSGELARSVEAVDGVLEARVHLAMPPSDPLSTAKSPPVRAAVLVKVGLRGRERFAPLSAGVQTLVAGAVPGLDAAAVSVVVTETAPLSPTISGGGSSWIRWVLLSLAATASLVAVIVLVLFTGNPGRRFMSLLRSDRAATGSTGS